MDPTSDHVSRLLERLGAGDEAVATELLPLVYDELRKLARGHMARERRSHTLQTTALVHEAWLRLSEDLERQAPDSRRQFFFLAGRAMRQVLVDHARTRGAQKRGGDRAREPLDDLVAAFEQQSADLLALDEALSRLGEVDPELVRLVELRFFAGLGHQEIADVLGTSLRSAERGWQAARSWLRGALSK